MPHRIISEPKRKLAFTPEAYTKNVSANITATWTWYNNDPTQGVVVWTFKNNGTSTATSILLRNGYFFGGAFWPVYEANSGFSVSFATALTPLTDNGVANNSPPIGIIDIGTNPQEVYFLFTLAAGQSWSMLEGGFSTATTPAGIAVYDVTLKNSGQYCIQYDQQRVNDWDSQTGTNLQGYSPNPSAFTTVEVASEADTPYDVLPFNDVIASGPCTGGTTPPPTPSPTTCLPQIEQGITEYESGQVSQGINDIINGILCLLQSYGIGKIKMIEKIIRGAL